jgi:hypothetical protein
MRLVVLRFPSHLALAVSLLLPVHAAAQSGGDFSYNPDAQKLPTNVILVKGAWSSASDSSTPIPESGKVAESAYHNDYFGLTYTLHSGWIEKYTGPPPSDSGYYVLAQLRPADTSMGATRGSVLIVAQDLFFTPAPASSAPELINYAQSHLQADYKVERPPTESRVAGHSFVRFDYGSPVAELHWSVLATQIRCHVLEFIFTSRDSKLVENLVQDLEQTKLPVEPGATPGASAGDQPVCIKAYAADENVVERVDPIFTERRFNSIPVRIIIDKDGRVKHIHFLSAFPEQAKAITDALFQWRFRPYLREGQPVEVETGLWFGQMPRRVAAPRAGAVSE